MNKKKVLLVVVALVLVCALSVMTTMALLAEKVNPVINTFVAAGGSDNFVTNFALKEYQYTQEKDGTYTKGSAVTGAEADNYVVNEYVVLPGTTIPKEAFVELQRTSDAPAYLFIEVKSGLSTGNAAADGNPVYTWSVSSDWVETAATGLHGGTVYVYKDVLGKVETTANYGILTNNSIVVNKNATAAEIGTTEVKMEFYAYICQATVANDSGTNTSIPAEVFDICF